MDEKRIDFSALDPKRDPAHFECMVNAVVAGVRPPATGADSLLQALLGWGRVAVACSVLLAVGIWVPTLVRWRQAASAPSDAIALVCRWAEEGAIPPAANVFQALEGLDGR
jgi:hypothetical protein